MSCNEIKRSIDVDSAQGGIEPLHQGKSITFSNIAAHL